MQQLTSARSDGPPLMNFNSAQRGEGALALQCDIMANKDVIESRETDQMSIRPQIYKELFSQARYAYELRDRVFPSASHTKGQSNDHRRISVLSPELLISHFNLREVASRQGYSTSFETEKLNLPVGSSATLERLDHATPDSGGTL